MSAFHRVDDIETLSAHRFFLLALRLSAYQGALRARAQEESESPTRHHYDAPNEHTERRAAATPNRNNEPSAAGPGPQEAVPVTSGSKVGGKTYYNDISHNPELAQYFD